MTKKEHEQIKAWNIAQGEAKAEAEAAYKALREKYKRIIGSVSCSYSDFLIQVSTCTKTTDAERVHDVYEIIKFHEADGRYKALFDYITAE